jgi:hypothetical protein
MYVDVDVEHARIYFQQFQYANDDIIDVAEARGLPLFGMMKTSGPVDGDVARVVVELHRSIDGGARVASAEVVEALEDGTVAALIEVIKTFRDAWFVRGRDFLEKFDVFLGVEAVDISQDKALVPTLRI